MIELLVVIIIIGILAAVAVPIFLSQRSQATDSAVKSDVRTMARGQETYFVANDDLRHRGADLIADGSDLAVSETVTVTICCRTTARGYCIEGASTQSDRAIWYYDSQAGGLQDKDVRRVSGLDRRRCRWCRRRSDR